LAPHDHEIAKLLAARQRGLEEAFFRALQLKEQEWKAILAITGMSLDHARRSTLWQTNPEQLHREIAAIDSSFASNFQNLVAQGKTRVELRRDDARF
jgi:hypothetical protein